MRRLCPLLVAACLIVFAAPTPQASARTILAATPISRLDLPWWKARFETKARRLHDGPVDLVFYGDSITSDWERHGPPAWKDFAPVWQRFYGERNAVNLGFVGDTTANLLWRIENGEAAGISPKVAVILIGANNLGRLHWSAADTISGIDAIISELRRRLPHTKLLLLGILPSDRTSWATATTENVNRILGARYDGGQTANVTYRDLSPVFLHGGRLERELFLDPNLAPPQPPLHPDAEGQARMAATMEPTLATLMGDHSHVRQ
ncbi:MAG: GDSL-type esterase/lipase family protein [Pseudomonadota bacterium]|nr:GDSL-type esterase/lipase family protein [Pseudomonadota bacterium]